MKIPPCDKALDPVVLADYWAGTLSSAEEETVEEHLLACDPCCSTLREISSLVDAIRDLAHKGSLNVVVSKEFLDHAAHQGLCIREYAPASGASVNCTVTQEDDLLIARLTADVASAGRVDLCFAGEHGTARLQNIPINPASHEVLLNVAIDEIRAAGPHVAKVQLLAVDPTGERVLGEYTFNHTPSPLVE